MHVHMFNGQNKNYVDEFVALSKHCRPIKNTFQCRGSYRHINGETKNYLEIITAVPYGCDGAYSSHTYEKDNICDLSIRMNNTLINEKKTLVNVLYTNTKMDNILYHQEAYLKETVTAVESGLKCVQSNNTSEVERGRNSGNIKNQSLKSLLAKPSICKTKNLPLLSTECDNIISNSDSSAVMKSGFIDKFTKTLPVECYCPLSYQNSNYCFDSRNFPFQDNISLKSELSSISNTISNQYNAIPHQYNSNLNDDYNNFTEGSYKISLGTKDPVMNFIHKPIKTENHFDYIYVDNNQSDVALMAYRPLSKCARHYKLRELKQKRHFSIMQAMTTASVIASGDIRMPVQQLTKKIVTLKAKQLSGTAQKNISECSNKIHDARFSCSSNSLWENNIAIGEHKCAYNSINAQKTKETHLILTPSSKKDLQNTNLSLAKVALATCTSILLYSASPIVSSKTPLLPITTAIVSTDTYMDASYATLNAVKQSKRLPATPSVKWKSTESTINKIKHKRPFQKLDVLTTNNSDKSLASALTTPSSTLASSLLEAELQNTSQGLISSYYTDNSSNNRTNNNDKIYNSIKMKQENNNCVLGLEHIKYLNNRKFENEEEKHIINEVTNLQNQNMCSVIVERSSESYNNNTTASDINTSLNSTSINILNFTTAPILNKKVASVSYESNAYLNFPTTSSHVFKNVCREDGLCKDYLSTMSFTSVNVNNNEFNTCTNLNSIYDNRNNALVCVDQMNNQYGIIIKDNFQINYNSKNSVGPDNNLNPNNCKESKELIKNTTILNIQNSLPSSNTLFTISPSSINLSEELISIPIFAHSNSTFTTSKITNKTNMIEEPKSIFNENEHSNFETITKKQFKTTTETTITASTLCYLDDCNKFLKNISNKSQLRDIESNITQNKVFSESEALGNNKLNTIDICLKYSSGFNGDYLKDFLKFNSKVFTTLSTESSILPAYISDSLLNVSYTEYLSNYKINGDSSKDVMSGITCSSTTTTLINSSIERNPSFETCLPFRIEETRNTCDKLDFKIKSKALLQTVEYPNINQTFEQITSCNNSTTLSATTSFTDSLFNDQYKLKMTFGPLINSQVTTTIRTTTAISSTSSMVDFDDKFYYNYDVDLNALLSSEVDATEKRNSFQSLLTDRLYGICEDGITKTTTVISTTMSPPSISANSKKNVVSTSFVLDGLSKGLRGSLDEVLGIRVLQKADFLDTQSSTENTKALGLSLANKMGGLFNNSLQFPILNTSVDNEQLKISRRIENDEKQRKCMDFVITTSIPPFEDKDIYKNYNENSVNNNINTVTNASSGSYSLDKNSLSKISEYLSSSLTISHSKNNKDCNEMRYIYENSNKDYNSDSIKYDYITTNINSVEQHITLVDTPRKIGITSGSVGSILGNNISNKDIGCTVSLLSTLTKEVNQTTESEFSNIKNSSKKISSSKGMFGEFLDKAAAAVQSATQVVNQGAFTVNAVVTKKSSTNNINCNKTQSPSPSPTNLNSDICNNDDILLPTEDNRTTVDTYYSIRNGENNAVVLKAEAMQPNYINNNQINIMTQDVPLYTTTHGSIGKKLPIINSLETISGDNSMDQLDQQTTEIRDDIYVIDETDYGVEEGNRNSEQLHVQQQIEGCLNSGYRLEETYVEYSVISGNFYSKDCLYKEEDLNVDEENLKKSEKENHPKELLNYPKQSVKEEANYFDLKDVLVDDQRESSSDSESYIAECTKKKKKITEVTAIKAHQNIKKQDSVIMEEEEYVSKNETPSPRLIEYTPCENLISHLVYDSPSKELNYKSDTNVNTGGKDKEQTQNFTSQLAQRSQKIKLIRGETEEVVGDHISLIVKRKPEITAKQRWHLAYNKIMNQLNICQNLSVVNDVAEIGAKFITDYNNKLTHNEEENNSFFK